MSKNVEILNVKLSSTAYVITDTILFYYYEVHMLKIVIKLICKTIESVILPSMSMQRDIHILRTAFRV